MNHHPGTEIEPPLVFRGSARSVGFARFCVFSLWLGFVATADLTDLGIIAADLHRPFGFLRIFGSDLSGWLAAPLPRIFQITLSVVLALLALGVRPFAPFAVTGVLGVLVFDTMLKGFAGWINHSHLGLLFSAFVIAMFPASNALAVFKWKPAVEVNPGVYRCAMALIAFALAFAYSFVGVRRVAMGPEVFWDDSLIGWIVTRTLQAPGAAFSMGFAAVNFPGAWIALKVGFAITTVFEILAPLAVFNDRFRRLWLVVIIPFHFFTWLTMNIFFWQNLVLIMVFFTGLSYSLVPWIVCRRQRPEISPPGGTGSC